MKTIKLTEKQILALEYYENGLEFFDYDEAGYKWANKGIEIINGSNTYDEIENAVDIARDNPECECCDNKQDYENMPNCKNYAWEFKALENLLEKI
tara:strand:- start:250 stop:537 length:288 start_codon:yes stop_codon:yes gene_type:complete